jgi:hypothetical protein
MVEFFEGHSTPCAKHERSLSNQLDGKCSHTQSTQSAGGLAVEKLHRAPTTCERTKGVHLIGSLRVSITINELHSQQQ